uniref:Ig-like domain-containing protein n=1 Tax=Cyprinodon variegatus TaxID=28743 RepID=A0A3Q2D5E2_CYPVA
MGGRYFSYQAPLLWNQLPVLVHDLRSGSADINCSHKKDISHTQMYWYRQRPGETMTLIVYTVYGGQQDYGDNLQTKYPAVKDNIETGALTVNDLQPDDSGVYFCAVSKYSDVIRSNSRTKTDNKLH